MGTRPCFEPGQTYNRALAGVRHPRRASRMEPAMPTRILCLAATLVLWLAPLAVAQPAASRMPHSTSLTETEEGRDVRPENRPQQREPHRPRNEFRFWAGGSFESPTPIGGGIHASLAMLGVRYARVLVAGDHLAVNYTVAAVPLAMLAHKGHLLGATGGEPRMLHAARSREIVYGAGGSPAGLQFTFRPRGRMQPFVGISGGMIYFNEPLPGIDGVPPERRGTRFNFMADLGAGVRFIVRGTRALTIGYAYHHVSNGERGMVNPGFESNLLYAGWSFFK
jgi:hypothetical protein